MATRRTKLGVRKGYRLVEYFVAETTARTAADLVGVNKATAALFYHKIRLVISAQIKAEAFAGEVEVDEPYFGGTRKGKRGRGAAGKVPVFGILKRAGKVYTIPIDNLKSETLIPIIKEKVVPDSIVYSDGFKSYDVLDVSEFKHEWGREPHANERIDHTKELVDKQGKHINGIENFWNQAKRVLRKYNGIPKHNFHLFISADKRASGIGGTSAWPRSVSSGSTMELPVNSSKSSNAGSGRRGYSRLI